MGPVCQLTLAVTLFALAWVVYEFSHMSNEDNRALAVLALIGSVLIAFAACIAGL